MPINHCAWEAQTKQVSGYSDLPRDFQAIVRPCLTQIKNNDQKNQELGMVVYSYKPSSHRLRQKDGQSRICMQQIQGNLAYM